MITQTISIQETKTHLSNLLKAVASGTEVIIAKSRKPLARLSSIEKSRPQIRFGVLKGKVNVSEDFDAPLTENILSEFEGS